MGYLLLHPIVLFDNQAQVLRMHLVQQLSLFFIPANLHMNFSVFDNNKSKEFHFDLMQLKHIR